MIVVDTNVVSYLVIHGVHSARAEAVRARDGDWHVPMLFRHEWLNVVTVHMRHKLLDRDDALRAYRRGIAMVKIDEAVPDPLQVLNLHMGSRCSSYDCQFVALAIDLDVKLVTIDQEVLDAFPDIALKPEGL
jgi:predicted nucleic acid-binding protein